MVVPSGNKSVVRTPLKGPSLRFLTHSLALTLTLSKFLRFSQLATFIKCATRRVFIHLTEEFNQSLVSQAFLIFPNIFISQVSIPPHLRMENLAPGFQYMVRPLPECSPPARFNAEGHYIKPRFQGYISTTISPPIVFYTTFTPRMLGRNSSLRFQTPLGTPPEHSWRERHRGLGSAGPSRAPSHNQ